MRKILAILVLFSISVFGQESTDAGPKRKKKGQSYFGAHTDLVFTRLEGLEGNERRLYWDDYIEDLNFNGIAAEGGLTGRYCSSLGVFYDHFTSQRFALHIQASYLQSGYREKITAFGETGQGSVEHTRKFKANLDYLHFLGGLKYYNDFGVTLMLGAYVNYNLVDKISNEEKRVFTGRFGTEEFSENKDYFFHEYYGENRTIFLTGGAFSIGYRWQQFEVDFSFKNSTQILAETDDMFMNFYQFGFRYQITKPEE